MGEKEIMDAIMVKASTLGRRLLRNNVGTGWVGQFIKPKRMTSYMLGENDVILKNARPLHAGLCTGSSDLIGWIPVKITPEMVGTVIAQFWACEVKDKGGMTGEQASFLSTVRDAGGRGDVARSPDEIK